MGSDPNLRADTSGTPQMADPAPLQTSAMLAASAWCGRVRVLETAGTRYFGS